MRNLSLVLVAGLMVLGARAEEAHKVPGDYVPVLKTGRISVFAESKSALTTDQQAKIQKALKSLHERYTSQYGLDKEVYKPGTLRTLVEPKSTVDLVIFPDLKKFEEWLGFKGAGGVTVHTGQYENVVGVPLENGEISEKFWWVLAHEFSHVFFAHILRTGGPIWLNEGLAEYFASTSKLYTATEHPHFKEMLQRLEASRKGETANRVSDLMLKPQREFGRQEYDEAWLLTHLLVSEFPTLFNEYVSTVRNFEKDAFADLEAVQRDIRKYAAALLEEAFGGPNALQEAFNLHLAAMLANPAEPAKSKLRPRGVTLTPIVPEIDSKLVGSAELVEDDDGNVYRSRSSSGTLRHRAPWTAMTRILVAVGDDKGNWSEEYIVSHAGNMKPGEKATWEDEPVPRYKNARRARVTAEWTIEGVGTYRTVKEFQFK